MRGEPLKAWGKSDIGRARSVNQDTYFVQIATDATQGLFVLCDGMGGAKAGEVASATAIDAFVEHVHVSGQQPPDLQQAVKHANAVVYNLAQSREEYTGMGTTLVAAYCCAETVTLVNVGDSRAYYMDAQGITQITADHSLVFEMIRLGELTPQQAKAHPSRNVITRALGAEESVVSDLFTQTVQPGQFVLLCSDGLTNHVKDEEILQQVQAAQSGQEACSALIELANQRGGQDNITVVLLAF